MEDLIDKLHLLRQHLDGRNADNHPEFGIRLSETETLTALDLTQIIQALARAASNTGATHG